MLLPSFNSVLNQCRLSFAMHDDELDSHSSHSSICLMSFLFHTYACKPSTHIVFISSSIAPSHLHSRIKTPFPQDTHFNHRLSYHRTDYQILTFSCSSLFVLVLFVNFSFLATRGRLSQHLSAFERATKLMD